MKLNGKENYIMLVSMGRHNIIFPWFFFFLFFASPAPRSTHCVSHIHVHSHSLVLGACVCVCLCILHHHLPGCASRSSCFLSIFYLFILCLRTYAPSSLTGVADWVAAWLTSWLLASLPASLLASLPACCWSWWWCGFLFGSVAGVAGLRLDAK